MNYQEELTAKLEAARKSFSIQKSNKVTTNSIEQKLLSELEEEFEFSQYDLEESDILRTLKILDILKPYESAFKHQDALKVFYVISRIDIITAKSLHSFLNIDVKILKQILYQMAKQKLLFQNNDNELELTLEGKSLADRLGIYIF